MVKPTLKVVKLCEQGNKMPKDLLTIMSRSSWGSEGKGEILVLLMVC
jgi:hypothetical protein